MGATPANAQDSEETDEVLQERNNRPTRRWKEINKSKKNWIEPSSFFIEIYNSFVEESLRELIVRRAVISKVTNRDGNHQRSS